MTKNLALAGVVLWLCATGFCQITINVPAGQPTIQAGINAALAGDTVLVAPGTYFENINFGGKAISVRSASGAAVTTINGGASGTVVSFTSGEGANSILDGFSITNGTGSSASTGGGIQCTSTSPTIRNCAIFGNTVVGGVVTFASAGGINCIFSNATVTNCTVTMNQGGDGSVLAGPGGIRTAGTGSVALTNCILWDNQPGAGPSNNDNIEVAGLTVANVTFSDIGGGFPGVGNIDADPAFLDAAAGDFHLRFMSPCIDAGTNGAALGNDYDGAARITGGTVDMGADETSFTVVTTFPYVTSFAFTSGEGFSSGGTRNSWQRGVPSGTFIPAADDGPFSDAWATNLSGNYQNDEDSYLLSPVFDLSGVTSDPVLLFRHIFQIGSGADLHWVEASINGGPFTHLGALNDPGSLNWYNANFFGSPPIGTGTGVWVGNSALTAGQWRGAAHRLTGAAGNFVQIRWRLRADGSGTAEGVGIDNMKILPLVDAFPYVEDFEGGDGGYLHPAQSPFIFSDPWEHGVPAASFISAANSGTNAWVTGLGGVTNLIGASILATPLLDCTGFSADPVIRFAHIFSINFGDVVISIDGGPFTKLGAVDDPFLWFNDVVGWFGTSGDPGVWRRAGHRLTGAAGHFCQVGWRGVTGTSEGMGVDDVEVRAHEGGQPADLGHALLDINGSVNLGGQAPDSEAPGPFYTTVTAGVDSLDFHFEAQPNRLFLLFFGDLQIAQGVFPPVGQRDIASGGTILLNGFDTGLLASLSQTGPGGTQDLNFGIVPPFLAGFTTTFQNFYINTVTTFRLSNAVHVTIQ